MKIPKHIEIVSSSQTTLSSMSLDSRLAILRVLSKHYENVGITIVNSLSDLKTLADKSPDLVFLGMKFLPSNPAMGRDDPDKLWISDYLDLHGITYTGSAQSAHQLELDKDKAKERVAKAGLSTSPFYVARQCKSLKQSDINLNYPLFIKPVNRGGGWGIDSDSVVSNFAQLNSKVRSIAANLQSDSLIEEYLQGREYSVAIMKNEDAAGYSVMPIELVAEPNSCGDSILSQKVKESDQEDFYEVLRGDLRESICSLALDVFHALGARDYGRIDIRMDNHDNPHFLEANLIPSLISGYGSFPKACTLNIGLNYEDMILKIVRLGLSRSRDKDFTESLLKEPYFNDAGVGLKTMFGTFPV